MVGLPVTSALELRGAAPGARGAAARPHDQPRDHRVGGRRPRAARGRHRLQRREPAPGRADPRPRDRDRPARCSAASAAAASTSTDASTWVSTDEVRPVPHGAPRLPSVRLTKYVRARAPDDGRPRPPPPAPRRPQPQGLGRARLRHARALARRADRVGRPGVARADRLLRRRRRRGRQGDPRLGTRPHPRPRRRRPSPAPARRPLVGLPALRLRGLYLAVTTFAFSLAADVVPPQPPVLRLGADRAHRRARRSSVGSTSTPPPACTTCASAGPRHVPGPRRHPPVAHGPGAPRPPRQRACCPGLRPRPDADRGSPGSRSPAASPPSPGCLFVHHQQAIDEASFFAGENFAVFTMVVVGGVASPAGALLGATFVEGIRFFLPVSWQLLASGIGVLLVLLLPPSGLGGLVLRPRRVAAEGGGAARHRRSGLRGHEARHRVAAHLRRRRRRGPHRDGRGRRARAGGAAMSRDPAVAERASPAAVRSCPSSSCSG